MHPEARTAKLAPLTRLALQLIMCAHMQPEARTAKLAPLTRLALHLITRAHTDIAAQVCEPKMWLTNICDLQFMFLRMFS